MAVLDDIRAGKGLKPITFNCFTCQNDNCIANSAKTATYQCLGYKRKGTNVDRIRSMTDEELAIWLTKMQLDAYRMGYAGLLPVAFPAEMEDWLDWLKQEAET